MKMRSTATWIIALIMFVFTANHVMGLTVSSPVVKEGGSLPAEFTGDGHGSSIPVQWSDVPAGSQSFALSLWHTAPDQEKSYWVVYNIPANIRALPKNVKGIGTMGYNDHNGAEYMPMKSQGPGVKEYHITVYALSAEPQFTTDKVTRKDLLEAIADITLEKATLTYTYERSQANRGSERGNEHAQADLRDQGPPRTRDSKNPLADRGGRDGVTAPGVKLQKIGKGYMFTEGPAVDPKGNVYFTDIKKSTIYKHNIDGTTSTYLTHSGGANGLMFDAHGDLVMCQGDLGRVASVNARGEITVLADHYAGKAFNRPNDLWIAPNSGIYFSDPAYGTATVQDGEHVYYISPDRSQVIRVINDMVRPNGIIGTQDGRSLYVTDPGADKTYRYKINTDGKLSDKTLFTATGGDGMTIDSRNNVYLAATGGIAVFNPEGSQKEMIEVPEEPTNVCLGGTDGQTLFITARSTLYTIQISVDDESGQGHGDNNQGNLRERTGNHD